jgi:hypothetical protein
MVNIFFCKLLIFILLLFSSGISAAAVESDGKDDLLRSNASSLLTSIQYGWPTHYFSQKLYSNFNTFALNIGYEKEGIFPKFWNRFRLLDSVVLEFRLLKLWGRGIPLYYDQVPPEKLSRDGKEPRTDWDTYQIGLTPYYRLYYPITRDYRPYIEVGAGMTWLLEELIEDGTRWNFSLYSGIGMDFKFCDLPLFLFFRFEHFSNGMKLWSQMGIADKRLIGPETMVFGLGFRYPLGAAK